MRAEPANTTRPSFQPLWGAGAQPGAPGHVLGESLSADVAVIGGGVAGISTALHLAEAGIDVAVIEADQPGMGATGQSGGLIAPNFIGLTPDSAVEKLGAEKGERLIRLIGGSARQCFELVEKHAINCNARQEGFWSPAHTDDLAERQKAQAGQWRAKGFDVKFVPDAEARAALGSPRYCGGLRFAEGGYLDPLACVRGLTAAAEKAGARIFTDSPVERISFEQGRWRVRTARGSVTAARVVLAANGGNSRLHRALRRTVMPLHVVEFATAPLSPAQRLRVLPAGGAFTDKQPYVFTARYDAHGRLISAFPASLLLRTPAALEMEARRRLRRHFPDLGEAPIERLWRGTAWLTPSLRPHLYDLDDGAYAIQACNGRGLATNLALGRELAEAIAARRFDGLSVPFEPPAPIGLHAVVRHAPLVLMTLAYLRSRNRRLADADWNDHERPAAA